MRKTFIALAFLVLLLTGVAGLSGITPSYIIAAPGVASGIGAKLLCSARYVSGFSEEQAFADLVQYSPVLQYLTIQYHEADKSVTANFLGLHSTTAKYRERIGCANQYPGVQVRETLEASAPARLASRWPHGNRVDSINPALQSIVEDILEEDNLQNLNSRALLLVKDGQIIAEAYGQGSGPNTPLLGWSMSKSLMSVMLGNLVMRGKLHPDATPMFAQWAQDGRGMIQLEDLLHMSDGLDFSEEYNPGDDATAMLFTVPSAADYVIAKPLLHPPGSFFNYSSGTANLLSKLYFDKVGGTLQSAYDDFIDNIVIPLSFQDAVFETDASGVFVGSSYFYASARDWARLGQLMLNGGEINGRRIVSREWVSRSVAQNQSDNNRAYGYQWWLNSGNKELRWPDLPADSFAAQGNRQQVLMVIPSLDVTLVRLGWTSGPYPVNENFAKIVRAVEGQ